MKKNAFARRAKREGDGGSPSTAAKTAAFEHPRVERGGTRPIPRG